MISSINIYSCVLLLSSATKHAFFNFISQTLFSVNSLYYVRRRETVHWIVWKSLVCFCFPVSGNQYPYHGGSSFLEVLNNIVLLKVYFIHTFLFHPSNRHISMSHITVHKHSTDSAVVSIFLPGILTSNLPRVYFYFFLFLVYLT